MEERQNTIDSLLEANQTVGEPFAFESQLETDTQPLDLSSKSVDESEGTMSNETLPVLTTHPSEKPTRIKRELITPEGRRRRRRTPKSKSGSSMRQMTMTQLFDPMESPQSTTTTTIKNEPCTPLNESLTCIPESLVGLAEPLDSPDERVRWNEGLIHRGSVFSPRTMSPT